MSSRPRAMGCSSNSAAQMRCAIDVQRAMAVTNQTQTADECLEFRIGINLGDMIVARTSPATALTGNIGLDLWMKKATGAPAGAVALLAATRKALDELNPSTSHLPSVLPFSLRTCATASPKSRR